MQFRRQKASISGIDMGNRELISTTMMLLSIANEARVKSMS